MSIEFMNRVWKQSKTKGSERLLLLAIADNADDEGFAWPGQEYLAKKVNMSRRYVIDLVEKLLKSGELYVDNRKEQGLNNRYIVMIGQTPETLRDVLVRKMRKSDNQAAEIIKGLLGVNYASHPGDQGGVNYASQGCEQEFTGGVNYASHKPPITDKEQSVLTPDEKEMIVDGLFTELVVLLNLPKKLLTPAMKRQHESFCYDLLELEAPARPGDIEHFGLWWYAEDWRGKKGQKPTLAQIRQHWKDAADWDAEAAEAESNVVAVY